MTLSNHNILFLIALGNIRYICWAIDRESAKRQAHSWIGGNSEQYVVTPLTQPGDRVKLDITLAI